MNWPNGLTLLRIVLIPAILYFVLVPGPNFGLIALGLFALAALTDAADGYLARWATQRDHSRKVRRPHRR
jgi:CDP-diacylglycerol---glycerol-3-phosphate 3-phosphatidyltransferase